MKEVSVCEIKFSYKLNPFATKPGDTLLLLWRNKNKQMHRKNKPALIRYNYENFGASVIYEFRINGKEKRTTIGPYLIVKSYEIDPNAALYWLDNKGSNITAIVKKWITENSIKLSETNYFEIPDEHKAEFRLRFM